MPPSEDPEKRHPYDVRGESKPALSYSEFKQGVALAGIAVPDERKMRALFKAFNIEEGVISREALEESYSGEAYWSQRHPRSSVRRQQQERASSPRGRRPMSPQRSMATERLHRGMSADGRIMDGRASRHHGSDWDDTFESYQIEHRRSLQPIHLRRYR